MDAKTPKSELTRAAIVGAALDLAADEGLEAITLQAVAADLGMSHTNLIHHFGSAGGLHAALMKEMVSELTATIESAVTRLRSGQGDVRDFVEIVFDAFDAGGAGQLAAWIALTRESDHLSPVGEVVRNHILNVERGAPDNASDVHRRITSVTLLVTMTAFGDAVIGDTLRKMVGRERDAVRKLIGDLLPYLVGPKREGADASSADRTQGESAPLR